MVDNIHLYAKNLRGSGAYWRFALSELIAMVKFLGTPHFFITLSCNDLYWKDMLTALLIADGRPDTDSNMLFINEKQKLIEKYPVIISRQFMLRVNAFMRYITKNPDVLGGPIVDYWWRIEFQNRGSPHLHMVVWVSGLPPFDSEEGIELIDRVVECSIPKDDEEMKSLVLTYQEHKHKPTCFKNIRNKDKSFCRFEFPRPVAQRTEILNTESKDFFKNGGRICVLQRTEEERNINNYNTTILKLWKANMDIQPCGNAKTVAYYVAKYMSKNEPTKLDRNMREAIKKISMEEKDNIKRKMHRIQNELLNNRRISTCQAAYRFCHLPLEKSSRVAVFIPGFTPTCYR